MAPRKTPIEIDIDALARLRALVKERGTARAAAAAMGVSEVYVHDLLRGQRRFSDNILEKLGLRRTIVQVKK